MEALWTLYRPRLLALARKRLLGTSVGLGQEEDAVLSALAAFFCGVQRGRFPRLHDRNDLWNLLVAITRHKIVDLLMRESRQPSGSMDGGQQIADPTPPPDVHLRLQELLDLLGDARLRAVAWSKLEGYTNEEIAATLGWTVRTIERKLRLIRSIWTEAFRIEEDTP
jgi:DNA-directed RNA polymerase specialized sigma24 family protein